MTDRRRDPSPDFAPSRVATSGAPVAESIATDPFVAQESFPGDNAFQALIPEIQRALRDTGYSIPTPVQAQCIPHLLAGRDLMGSAQTGTGKTAAFTLPLLQKLALDPKPSVPRKPRVLILAPTRELAAQIADSIATYGKYLRLNHAVVFGGVAQRPQEFAMKRGVDFLVATPGRLLDLIRQRYVQLDAVEAFVLDEADRMLDLGFILDVKKILGMLPAQRQSLFFSATLPPAVSQLAGSMLQNAVRVTITPDQPTVERISQKVLFVDRGSKDSLLIDLLNDPLMNKVIVFAQRKHVADKVTKTLLAAGVRAAAIHGNKSQNNRTAALDGFRRGRIRALVATDIAARGIDVDGISHVINYELPQEAETYVHRIGRTARAGAEGDAVSLCCASERNQLRAIERFIRKNVPVHRDHSHHSPEAERATGEAARPPGRGQQQRRPQNARSQRPARNNGSGSPAAASRVNVEGSFTPAPRRRRRY